ncbi:VOC family protein [Streptomyces sp. NPDC055709]
MGRPITHASFVTLPVSDHRAKLAAAGVTVDGPSDVPWGRMAGFTDPDGNGLMLLTENDGAEGA